MHRLAVVSERDLGAACGVASALRSFSPRITVGMKSHSFDPHAGAALLEFRRAVARSNQPQVGKKRTGVGQCAKSFLDLVPKMNERKFAGFLPGITDYALFQVDDPLLQT